MPRMARSQSLPINRVGIDDGRLVRSASPRRRSDEDDDPGREDDAATASRLGRVLALPGDSGMMAAAPCLG